MDAKSKFITCKAYDELMSLQSIVLSFPYQEVNGVFKIATDVDVYDLYCQIFEQINSKKHIQELYGVDIIYKIDPRLRGTKVPYLLLSERSAWETLQDLAAFSLCHIYCTRGGEVHVVCDIPPQAEQVMSADTDTLHDLPPSVTISDAKILPVNSFTYQLPVQSKTLVNRVVMPYIEITDDGKAEDNTIEIKKDSIETVSYVEGGVTKQKMVFTVELKNFYKEINSFTLNNITEVGEQIVETSKILIFFDKAYFEFNKIEITEKLVLKINVEKTNLNINRMKVIKELPDKTSIKANGVSEYTHPDSYLLVSLENAVAKSNLILHKYNNGVAYIETDWIGTPNLSIGSRIACQGLRDASPKIYEALSNEFTLNGGLRCKTKLSEGQT